MSASERASEFSDCGDTPMVFEGFAASVKCMYVYLSRANSASVCVASISSFLMFFFWSRAGL